MKRKKAVLMSFKGARWSGGYAGGDQYRIIVSVCGNPGDKFEKWALLDLIVLKGSLPDTLELCSRKIVAPEPSGTLAEILGFQPCN